MGLFVVVDFLEVAVERVGESGLDEVGLRVVCYAFLVELALQVLEGEGIVKLWND